MMPFYMLVIGWIADAFIMFDFMKKVLGNKYRLLPSFGIFFAVRVACIVIVYGFYDILFVKIIFTFATTFITVIIFFKSTLRKKIMSIVIYSVITAIAEYIPYAAIYILVGGIEQSNDIMLAVILAVSYICLYIFGHIAATWINNESKYSFTQIILIILQTIIAYSQYLYLHPRV